MNLIESIKSIFVPQAKAEERKDPTMSPTQATSLFGEPEVVKNYREDGTLDSVTTNRNTEDGHETSVSIYDEAGNVINTKIYHYAHGTQDSYSEDNDGDGKIDVKYDDLYDEKGNYTGRMVSSYGANGDLVKTEVYDKHDIKTHDEEYTYENGLPAGKTVAYYNDYNEVKLEESYDANDMLLSQTSYDSGIRVEKTDFRYNSDNSVASKMVTKYTKNGEKVLSERQYDDNGVELTSKVYTYSKDFDNSDNPTKTELLYNGDKLSTRTVIEYQKGGQIPVRESVYDENNTRIKFSQDKNGDGKFDNIQEFNEKDQLVLESVDADKDGVIDSRTAYEYNDAGRIIKRLEDHDNDGIYNEITQYNYEDGVYKGMKVSVVQNPDGTAAYEVYEYDENDNLISSNVVKTEPTAEDTSTQDNSAEFSQDEWEAVLEEAFSEDNDTQAAENEDAKNEPAEAVQDAVEQAEAEAQEVVEDTVKEVQEEAAQDNADNGDEDTEDSEKLPDIDLPSNPIEAAIAQINADKNTTDAISNLIAAGLPLPYLTVNLGDIQDLSPYTYQGEANGTGETTKAEAKLTPADGEPTDEATFTPADGTGETTKAEATFTPANGEPTDEATFTPANGTGETTKAEATFTPADGTEETTTVEATFTPADGTGETTTVEATFTPADGTGETTTVEATFTPANGAEETTTVEATFTPANGTEETTTVEATFTPADGTGEPTTDEATLTPADGEPTDEATFTPAGGEPTTDEATFTPADGTGETTTDEATFTPADGTGETTTVEATFTPADGTGEPTTDEATFTPADGEPTDEATFTPADGTGETTTVVATGETITGEADTAPVEEKEEQQVTDEATGEDGQQKETETVSDKAQKAQELINKLYNKPLEELIAENSNLINSSVLSTQKGTSALSKAMANLGIKADYSGKYASKATIDFATAMWDEKTLNDLGINKNQSLYNNPNQVKATNENSPKVGDIVFMGEKGEPYHNGVVVAIVPDENDPSKTKYIVQEGNSAKANKGGALVAYTLTAQDGHAKHIQSYIPINQEEVQQTVSIETNIQDTQDTAPIAELDSAGDESVQETKTTPQQNVEALYGSTIEVNGQQVSMAELSNLEGLETSTKLASIGSANKFSTAMKEKLGIDANYTGRYASRSTVDFASTVWDSDTLEAAGITSNTTNLYDLAKPLSENNMPKVGDIVTMGDYSSPYHTGVVVAITKDGKYVVQEGNSAKANKGGALVIYDTKPGKANSKHIQGFISINKSEDGEQPADENTQGAGVEFGSAFDSYANEAKELFGDDMISRSDVSGDEFREIAANKSLQVYDDNGVLSFMFGTCVVKLVDGKIEIE